MVTFQVRELTFAISSVTAELSCRRDLCIVLASKFIGDEEIQEEPQLAPQRQLNVIGPAPQQ